MPKKVSLNELKEKMGDDFVKKLYDEFAGKMIYVPKKGIDMTQEEKEKYILNLYYDSGVNYQDIAKRVNLSVDRVKKIVCEKYKQKIAKS